MSTEVASTEYGVIIRYDDWNALELRWLPTTKDATEAQARDTMALFAAETEKRKPRFLIGEGFPFPTVESGADPAPEGPAAFPTGWFASRDRAYQWLAG